MRRCKSTLPRTRKRTRIELAAQRVSATAWRSRSFFLGPKELEFEDALKNDIEDLTFSKAKLGTVLDVLARTTMQKTGNNKNPSNYSRNNPTEHVAVKALLSAAEKKKMQSDTGLKSRAEDAFRSHVRAVAAYPSSLKHIFHVKRHLGHVAGAFAWSSSNLGW